jgi:2-methylaconitate cis-trans-isomerase PrpF
MLQSLKATFMRGGTTLTSKIAVVSRPEQQDADIGFLFA